MNRPMIEVSALRKAFPETYRFSSWLQHRGRVPQRVVLEDVSFGVERGEIFGLLGANGAGKTTLLKLIATIALPAQGSIVIDGVDAVRDPLAARARIGFSPSDYRSFYYRMSARENLRYFGALAGVQPTALESRIQRAAATVDLENDLDRRFSTFSNGMRQRLCIARALLHDPPVLLLDEPTHAVDPLHTEVLHRLIRERLAGEGKCVVVSTNIIDEAWSLCDRVAILRSGRIVALDGPARLRGMAGGRHRYAIEFGRIDGDLVERLETATGVYAVELDVERPNVVLVEMHPQQGAAINEMLMAASCNGIQVRRVEPLDPAPSAVFSSLLELA